MTQTTTINKITELNGAFFQLNSTNQDYAMAILRSLKFAQENSNREIGMEGEASRRHKSSAIG